jgi:hypothetical protein
MLYATFYIELDQCARVNANLIDAYILSGKKAATSKRFDYYWTMLALGNCNREGYKSVATHR